MPKPAHRKALQCISEVGIDRKHNLSSRVPIRDSDGVIGTPIGGSRVLNPDVIGRWQSGLLLKACKIKFNESMSLHTSFKIGGPCKIFVVPKTEEGLELTIKYATQNKLPLVVVGNGTNLLFPDEGFYGVIMRIGEPYFSDVGRYCDMPIRVGAGISISRLLKITAKYGLSGLDFMTGIPGTLGGAVTMNAGAYGKRIGAVIKRVKVMNRKGNVYWVKNEEAEFGYRESRFKRSASRFIGTQKGAELILEAELNLNKEDPTKVNTRMQEIMRERETKFPLEFPSAGCVFKNPSGSSSDVSERSPSTMPAGKLIELAGCKELRIGDAQVSGKHANFIINLGNATYKEVKALISEVQHRVYEKFKISLEPEIVIL